MCSEDEVSIAARGTEAVFWNVRVCHLVYVFSSAGLLRTHQTTAIRIWEARICTQIRHFCTRIRQNPVFTMNEHELRR